MKRLIGIILVAFIFGAVSYSQIYKSPAKSVEVLKQTTNETADSSYSHFYMGEYDKFSLELRLSGGVSCKIFASNDETLSSSNEADWVNFNTAFFGADSVSDVSVLKYNSSSFSPVRVLLKYRNADNSNSNKTILTRYK